jgi:hypothetical protein
VNGYAGWIAGGDVVRSLFRTDASRFAYIETIFQF